MMAGALPPGLLAGSNGAGGDSVCAASPPERACSAAATRFKSKPGRHATITVEIPIGAPLDSHAS